MPFTCDGATIATDAAIVRGLSDAERKGSDMAGGRVTWAEKGARLRSPFVPLATPANASGC
ncbi:hypothetical protein [Phyllobacterium myrsinacearum]|uniref:Uncharacterized protein n=1 Tax=Phyllobacterium myrsinacearum TaxID=28101 RepID=A0A2S9JXJ6_9HYPH|nr:hypothetical protein [Phyllobacterium myrsinacearum]PRD58060.1 hypothetical protein C5750_02660 [Phyllobacterium myrsinacearum]